MRNSPWGDVLRFSFTPWVLPLLFGTLLSLVVAWLAAKRRPAPGAGAMALTVLALAVWTATYSLELIGADLETKVFWGRMKYLGIIAAPLAWTRVCTQYIGREHVMAGRRVLYFLIIPCITLALLVTTERHGLIHKTMTVERSGPFEVLRFVHGPWYWVHFTYLAGLSVGSAAAFLKLLKRETLEYRRQAMAVVLWTVVPIFTITFRSLRLGPWPYLDFTPFALILTSILIFWSFYRFRFLDLVPIAREAVIEGMRDAVVVLDGRGRIVDVNPAARTLLGSAPEGHTLEEVSPQLSLCSDGATFEWVSPLDGVLRIHDVVVASVGSKPGRGSILTLRDVTALRQAERRLKESEQRYRSLFHHSADWVCGLDVEGRIESTNEIGNVLSGYLPHELLHKPLLELVASDDQARARVLLEAAMKGESEHGEFAMLHRNGHLFDVQLTALPIVVDGRIVGVYFIARDITERKQTAARIAHLAMHDALTGLPNRAAFHERLNAVVPSAGGRGGVSRFALLYVDLDGFKRVNDTCGHEVGDQLLCAVSERLRSLVRMGDTVSRMGGDEFTVILVSEPSRENVDRVGRRIVEALCRPFELGGRTVRIGASVGVAMYPENGGDIESLLRSADAAMYHVKVRGKGAVHFFSSDVTGGVSSPDGSR